MIYNKNVAAQVARHPPLGAHQGESQLRFIHIRRLFRIQYACFELDTVDIDWWTCVHICLVKESLTYPWKQQCLDYVGLPLQPDVVTELEADCSTT